ncbi:MAG: cation transporter [Treponema sp.]|nr:cation transporter [Treponema sp.]
MSQNREKTIIFTSVLGIFANIALASFKAVVGMLSHSIAIVLDAVNNTTDALSSVVTIIGTKLAGKPADKEHPYGHGRAEYLTALVISVIILYAGVTSLFESIKKIITPTTPDYKPLALVVVAVAVVVKISLGLFVKSTGKRVHSDSLVASGQDAFMDAIISVSTLIAAAVFLIFGISLEAYLGILISFMIIKAGVEILRETLSKILGERIDAEMAHGIKKTVASVDPEIRGAFDLILNNYGPDNFLGSIHIEVPDTWTADKIDIVTRKIVHDVAEKHHVVMTAVGVYSCNTKDDSASHIRTQVSKIVHEHKDVLQMHGFFVDEKEKIMRFDVVVSFDSPDIKAMHLHIIDDVRRAFPDYDVQIQLDYDVSD